MKHCLYSFLSRLALPGLMLLLMTAGTLSADTFGISVNFGGGFTGTGSFNTNGTCDPCTASAGTLTNFVFTVDDDTFNEANAVAGLLEYFRIGNTLGSVVITGSDNGGDSLVFSPGSVAPIISFEDSDDPPHSVQAAGTVSAVPEPTSLLLLAGGIVLLVLGLTRFRKKSAIH